MIQQNELRLGNWFYDGFVDKEGNLKPARVRQILEYVREDEFSEPIPLTPEILEKAGFEKEPGLLIYTHAKLGTGIIFKNMSRWFLVKAKDGRQLTSIEYVHQLQNLYYALTGEELQIDL